MVTRLVSLAVLLVAAMGATVLSQQVSGTPRFEAVSVKPCDPNADAGGVRSNARPSPNRLFIPCMPARAIVRLAFMSGRNPRDADLLAGGPDWLGSERFTIEAVADPAIPRATISGPMFQAVLAERFGLKIRRETRQVRAYALVVAPPKTTLSALRQEDCVQKPSPQPARPRKPDCDLVTRAATDPPLTLSRLLERTGQGWSESRGNDRVYHALPITMDAFALFLDSILDRPVTNGTGLKGLFDIRLEYSLDGTFPPPDPEALVADPPRAPSIFTALREQLGLSLESTQAPADVVVIESIERPEPN